MELTAAAEAPRIPVRPMENHASFVVGDASGEGFGSMSWSRAKDKLKAVVGLWNIKTREESSSNFREAANFVRRLKQMNELGEVSKGTEVFIFTDNFVFESIFYKGSSTLPRLHEVVVELRKLEMSGDFIVHVVWIAGTRMITQGSDGLSRGDNSTGAMAGKDFLDYIPLNLNAFERQANIKRVIEKTGLEKTGKQPNPRIGFTKCFKSRRGNGYGPHHLLLQKWLWNSYVK